MFASTWKCIVNTSLFYPRLKLSNPNRPILLYVGNISSQCNLKAFLDIPIKGLKRLVGTGPDLYRLRHEYPYAQFIEDLSVRELAKCIAMADCFVYPSLNHESSIHLIQALVSGIPVAGYPIPPLTEIINKVQVGNCNESLERAIENAIATAIPDACVQRGKHYLS